MEIDFLQWTGYLASGIIALSMMMNSILKFRWINLAGALTFSVYGFLINALPVGFLNAFIALVDVYYLYTFYSRKEVFELMEVSSDNSFLQRFAAFHHKDIQHFFPDFDYEKHSSSRCFFVLRNMAVAGIFIAEKQNETHLEVYLDYVIPEYRDLKNGKYIYLHLREQFINEGFTKVIATGHNPNYSQYLVKLGFEKNAVGKFEKTLI